MKAIDMQTLMGTERGAMFKDPALLAELAGYFRSPGQRPQTEEEIIQEWRQREIRVVLCSTAYQAFGWRDFGEIRERHDYLGQLKRDYPDVILGAWIGLDPTWGMKGIRELERCIREMKTFGILVAGAITAIPANDYRWWPYYDLCQEARVPIKIMVGAIALGAGQPGGRGIRLYTENPIPYLDDVAAQFPELVIVAHHAPMPFHHEMVTVLVHKANVYNELHGWSPRYFPQEFKDEIGRRIQEKVMFGSDYPLFSYDRLFRDWEGEGYRPEVLEKVFYKNAQRLLDSLEIPV